MPVSIDTLNELIEVAAKLTGRRYCTHHGGEADASAGSFVIRNKSKRWICDVCEKKTAKRNAEIHARASA